MTVTGSAPGTPETKWPLPSTRLASFHSAPPSYRSTIHLPNNLRLPLPLSLSLLPTLPKSVNSRVNFALFGLEHRNARPSSLVRDKGTFFSFSPRRHAFAQTCMVASSVFQRFASSLKRLFRKRFYSRCAIVEV